MLLQARKKVKEALMQSIKVVRAHSTVVEPKKILKDETEIYNFENLSSHHLNKINEVRDFLVSLKKDRPGTKEECLKVNHILSRFFILNYRKLNPDLDIDTS